MDLSEFHFLHPWWLLLALAGAALPWLWSRQHDPRRTWGNLIAPALLEYLLIGAGRRLRLRPVHEIAALLILAGIAVAGPTWQREPPPFAQDKAPLIIALDLSRSMDATDIAPTRLERAKQKVRDLMARRSGARTGLVVYAGSAHLVVPPTADPDLMNEFLPALSTDLMPRAGRNAGAALALADKLFAGEAGGSVLFITDDMDPSQSDALRARPEGGLSRQLLMLAVGTSAGGPLRDTKGGIQTGADGQPQRAGFNRGHFEQVSKSAGIPVTSATLDDSDVRWVERRAQRHWQIERDAHAQTRWTEPGYYLCFPIALLAALWFRRGWVVRWLEAACVVVLLGAPAPARAFDLHPLDWFVSRDQQGRWYFEHGDYARAGEHFDDARWKGFSYYRSGDYPNALAQFARGDSAEDYFMMGNCQARLRNYSAALAAYDNALKRRRDFPQAGANRELMIKLLRQPPEEDEEAPQLKPDQIKFDKKGQKGQEKTMEENVLRQQNADRWMRNLSVSPAKFLRAKFAAQAQEPPP